MEFFGGNLVMPIFIRIKLKLKKTGYFKFLRSKYIEPCKISIRKKDLKSLISTMQGDGEPVTQDLREHCK